MSFTTSRSPGWSRSARSATWRCSGGRAARGRPAGGLRRGARRASGRWPPRAGRSRIVEPHAERHGSDATVQPGQAGREPAPSPSRVADGTHSTPTSRCPRADRTAAASCCSRRSSASARTSRPSPRAWPPSATWSARPTCSGAIAPGWRGGDHEPTAGMQASMGQVGQRRPRPGVERSPSLRWSTSRPARDAGHRGRGRVLLRRQRWPSASPPPVDPDAVRRYYGSGIAVHARRRRPVACPILFHFGEARRLHPRRGRRRHPGRVRGTPRRRRSTSRRAGHAFDNHRADVPRPEAAAAGVGDDGGFLGRALRSRRRRLRAADVVAHAGAVERRRSLPARQRITVLLASGQRHPVVDVARAEVVRAGPAAGPARARAQVTTVPVPPTRHEGGCRRSRSGGRSTPDPDRSVVESRTMSLGAPAPRPGRPSALCRCVELRPRPSS